jgi:phospholipase C
LARARKRWWIRSTPVVVACVGALSVPGIAHASPVFTDGFESGNLSSWTKVSGGFSVQQQLVFDGAWAARATTSGAAIYASKTLSATYADLYADLHLEVVSTAGTAHFLRFNTAKGSGIVGLAVKSDGRLLVRNFTTRTSATSSTKVSFGSWHEVQLHAGISGSSSTVEVWLDGTKVSDVSTTYPLGTTPVGRFLLGTSASGPAYDIAFDDAVVDTAFIGGPPPPTDTTAPSVPTGLSTTQVLPREVDLSWDPSTDPDSPVAGYTVYRDGTAVGTSTATSFPDKTVQPSTTYSYTVDAFDAAGNRSNPSDPLSVTTPEAPPLSTPIQHVVIIFQENHSFDDVLGKLCVQIAAGTVTGHDRCDGATQGTLSNGQVIPLSQEPDIVPDIPHTVGAQQTAIDGGKMDGFDKLSACGSASNYACYAQFDPSQIPNLTTLAATYVISDRTFEFATTPTWAGHMVLAASTVDGFQGNNPQDSTFTTQTGPGWGCDSFKDALWWDGSQYVREPACVPDQSGAGPYRPSPVSYVPTIFDRVEAAGLTWKIFGGSGTSSGYVYAICPTFYECLGSSQRANFVDASNVLTAATAGTLPNLAVVTPTSGNSQHNNRSMATGDNWIGQVVSAIQSGPDWSSTAIFITYDDCGCFYDHVPPPTQKAGIRVPMVIVSPYAKPGYTDSGTATFVSMLAYVEHIFGLQPLNDADANAYDYGNSFDYSQTPLGPARMVQSSIPLSEMAYLITLPPDEEDPT